MTYTNAILGEIEPFSVSTYAVEKVVIDEGLNADGTYSSVDKIIVAKCALKLLVQMLPLTSETTGHAGTNYDRSGLEERIKAICFENGIDVTDYIAGPRVIIYPPMF